MPLGYGRTVTVPPTVLSPAHPLAMAAGTSPDEAFDAFESYAAGRGLELYGLIAIEGVVVG